MTCGCNGNGNGVDDTVDEINVQQGTPISYVSSDSCGTYSAPCSCSCVTITPDNSCVQQSVCSSFPNVQPAPTPYYAAVCQESHTQTVVSNCFTTAIKAANSFNMPSSGGSTILTFTGLCGALVGSYLWNPHVGYLKITQVDLTNGQVTVTNENQSGNAAPGTAFAACMYFIITIPPTSTGSSSGCGCNIVYLAADFTSPPVGTCIDITVTTVAGLAVGKNVSIGTSTFRVSAIKSATLITVCNDGGAVAGLVILARNSSNELQYQVILLDTNPCSNPQVNAGSLLVCCNGVSQPLHGTAVGQVPVLQNTTTNQVEFETLNFEVATCTTLTTGIAFIAGTDTYTISVGSTTGFLAGDGVHVMGWWDIFLVDTILDGTHMIIKTNGTHVPVNSDVPCGTQICKYACCENLDVKVDGIQTLLQGEIDVVEADIVTIEGNITTIQGDITDLENTIAAQRIFSGVGVSAPFVGTLLSTPGEDVDGNVAGLSIANTSADIINVMVVVTSYVQMYYNNMVATGWTLIGGTNISPDVGIDTVELVYGFAINIPATPTISAAIKTESHVLCPLYHPLGTVFECFADQSHSFATTHLIPPGDTLNLVANANVLFVNGSLATDATNGNDVHLYVNDIRTRIAAFAVGIQ